MKAIIKLSSMGDIIHSLAVLPLLNEKIDFIVDSSFKEILNYHPLINNIIDINLRAIKKDKKQIFKEIKRIKRLNYQEVYDLQGLLKSAIVAKMVSKNRVGYKNPREKIASLFYTTKINSVKKYAIEKYLELFEIEDKEFLTNHPKLLFFKEREFDFLSKNKKNIVFIIGATWRCKKADITLWKELAKSLNENIIIPYSSLSEKKEALEIAKVSSNVIPISLNLNDLKALIDKVDLLIGNDTGPSFIAWANNINNIILYGCTYNNKILENSYSKSLEVQKELISKKLYNINQIKVKDVMDKINEFSM